MTNPIGWVEIPVNEMDRAIAFYNHIFGFDLKLHRLQQVDMAFFPMSESGGPGASGALVYNQDFYKPSDQAGALVYFACEDINAVLDRVNEKGGSTMVPKTQISEENGYMAVFRDSEGNRVALHSRN